MVKGVLDPSPRTESWPSQFILSLGPWQGVGCRLGVKNPSDGSWGLGWALGQSQAWTLGVSSLFFLPPAPTPCRMILSVLTGLLFGSDGYYVALAWTSSALMYFIVSLRLAPLCLGSELQTGVLLPAQL